jgi:hypothetical protein
MLKHTSAPPTPQVLNKNGLGEGNVSLISEGEPCQLTMRLPCSLDYDIQKPFYKDYNLAKPDPRLKPRNIEIKGDDEETSFAFVDVKIIDSTGKDAYRGDVLVKGKRIVSVGSKLDLNDPELKGVRIIQGEGRTLMSGMCDAHTHFSWTNAGSLDGLATMPVEGELSLDICQSEISVRDCADVERSNRAHPLLHAKRSHVPRLWLHDVRRCCLRQAAS